MDKKTYKRLCDKFNKIHKQKGDLTIADALFGVEEVLGMDAPKYECLYGSRERCLYDKAPACENCQKYKEAVIMESCRRSIHGAKPSDDEREWRKALLDFLMLPDFGAINGGVLTQELIKEKFENLRQKFL